MQCLAPGARLPRLSTRRSPPLAAVVLGRLACQAAEWAGQEAREGEAHCLRQATMPASRCLLARDWFLATKARRRLAPEAVARGRGEASVLHNVGHHVYSTLLY